MKIVRAVVQIVGHSTVPVVPKYTDDLTEWYRKVRHRCPWIGIYANEPSIHLLLYLLPIGSLVLRLSQKTLDVMGSLFQ